MKNRVRSRRPTFDSLEGRTLMSSIPLTVTTLADDFSGHISGQTTLRDAINTVNLNPSLQYNVTFSVAGKIALQASLPSIAGTVTLAGSCSAVTIPTWSSSVGSMPLQVSQGSTVVITGMVIDGGNAQNYNAWSTNCIVNAGSLSMSSCTISGNHGSSPIVNAQGASLVLYSDAITNNTSLTNGGAIDNAGTLSVNGVLFTNDCAIPAMYACGGAIYNEAQGTATVTSSICSVDTAFLGTSIYNAGVLTIDFYTIAHMPGGALYNTGQVHQV